MKVFSFLLLFTITLFPQTRWGKLNGPGGASIRSILSKGDTIVVGTGYVHGTVYFTTNAGENWNSSTLRVKGMIENLMFSNDGGLLAISLYDGIYKSFDFVSWIKLFNNNVGNFWSLGKDSVGNIYAGGDYGRIIYSSNNGLNWVMSRQNDYASFWEFLTNKENVFASGPGLILKRNFIRSTWDTIFYSSQSGNINLFEDSDHNLCFLQIPNLYKSTDNGITWSFNKAQSFFKGYAYDCMFNKKVLAAMEDVSELFGDVWGIAISDDFGINWRWSHYGLPRYIAECTALTKSSDKTYLGTGSAGVLVSTDFGDSWNRLNNGLNSSQIQDLYLDTSDTMYSAAWSNGIFKSTDKGNTWELKENGITTCKATKVISDNEGVIFAGTAKGLFRSTDYGESWSMVYSVGDYYVRDLYKDKRDRIYCVNYLGIFRSTDHGENWVAINNIFSSTDINCVSTFNDTILVAGLESGSIYRSANDGLSWSSVYNTSAGSAVLNIAVTKEGLMYAGSAWEGILRSTDIGKTWSVIRKDNGYPSTVGVNSKGIVYAGTSIDQIIMSKDKGDTWTEITDNAKLLSVYKITFDKDDNVYIGTDDGIWKSAPDTITAIASDELKPETFSLSQNYPNPFNPTTTISFSIPNSSLVEIVIYNSLGQHLGTILKQYKDQGNYSVSWDGTVYPSGVYFYELKTNDRREIRKMLLLK